MISVETSNPVISNFRGDRKKRKSTTPSKGDVRRSDRRSNRRAKRNAPKLKRVRRKSGKTSFVMKLIKLAPAGKQKFSGTNGLTPLIPISIPTEYTKTFADGITIIIQAVDVIVHASGVFDKNDIAKALGIAKETLTQEMIDKFLVYIAPVSVDSNVATETNRSASSDVAIEVPATNVVETLNGTFLATDTQPDDEPPKDVAVEDSLKQNPLKKNEKLILWGGVALVVLIIGVIIFRKMKKSQTNV